MLLIALSKQPAAEGKPQRRGNKRKTLHKSPVEAAMLEPAFARGRAVGDASRGQPAEPTSAAWC
jgi:hypothetical protein